LTSMLLAALALVGCASPSHRAPVEDRTTGRSASPAPAVAAPSADPAKPPPGAENAGKPGFYTVKQGDTVLRVALETGQNWRDIARWNNLDNPNVLEVGQVLRVVPPASEAAAAQAAAAGPKPVTTPRVDVKPLDPPKPGASASSPTAAAGPDRGAGSSSDHAAAVCR
jgi:lipoprotein NlpD